MVTIAKKFWLRFDRTQLSNIPIILTLSIFIAVVMERKTTFIDRVSIVKDLLPDKCMEMILTMPQNFIWLTDRQQSDFRLQGKVAGYFAGKERTVSRSANFVLIAPCSYETSLTDES
jgi:hypothetical protein